MHFNLIRLIVLCASLCLLSCANAQADDTKAWILQQRERLVQLEKQHAFKQAQAFALQKQHKNKQQYQKYMQWAEKIRLKPKALPMHSSREKPTKNGVDINQLLQRYQSKMPSVQKILHQQKHDLLIFISFSMPKQSLRLWLEQAMRAGGILVLRGLVGDSFKKTALAVQQLVGDRGGGVEIDPILFRRFHIKQVPAVVVMNHPVPRCFNLTDCLSNTPDYDVIYGDVSLESALKEILNKSQINQKKVRLILTHMSVTS